MEVFMNHVPSELTENAFKTQLEPFMRELSIVDYSCEKPKNRRFANVTFLNPLNAQRFLASHGEETLSSTTTLLPGRSRTQSRLKNMSSAGRANAKPRRFLSDRSNGLRASGLSL